MRTSDKRLPTPHFIQIRETDGHSWPNLGSPPPLLPSSIVFVNDGGFHHSVTHVCLRAAAGLPDAQREVIVQFSIDHFVTGVHDQFRFVVWQLAEIFVNEGSRLFENSQRADHLARHAIVADIEVV